MRHFEYAGYVTINESQLSLAFKQMIFRRSNKS
jgi:hypothetical protein